MERDTAASGDDDLESRASTWEPEPDHAPAQSPAPSFEDRLLASVALLERTAAGRRAVVFWALMLARAVAGLVEQAHAGDPRRVLRLVERWITDGHLTKLDVLVHAYDSLCAVGTTQAATSAASLVKQLALLAYAAAGGIREGGRWGSGADLERVSMTCLAAGIARDAERAGLHVPEIPLPS